MAPFYEWGSTASRLQSHFEEAVYFLPLSSRNSLYSFDSPRRHERLSRPWSHPVVLNMHPLDWESSALNTRPLLHKIQIKCSFFSNRELTPYYQYKNCIIFFSTYQISCYLLKIQLFF